MKKTTSLALVALLAFAAPLVVAPRPAEACGGMFCDGGGPVSMRVDQTGENIVYSIANGRVEAHIQIQYTGAAARFAWVLPVQKSKTGTPVEIGIGSQRLFDALLGATVPTYTYTTQNKCPPPPNSGASGAGGGFGSAGSAGSSGGGGPQIVAKGTAGAFDYVVIDVPAGGSAAELMTWLDTNKYSQVPEAEPLFADYISKGYQFVAIRLTGDAGVEEIHPLVVKYDGDTPCVPIKLTKVAAKENMGIRTFFLNSGRMVPTNYRHVTLNDTRVNWLQLGTSYADLVNAAVDAPIADGHGFVTEYAGPSNIVPTFNIYSAQWAADAYATATPTTVVDTLKKQGLMSCNGVDQCSFAHPLVASVLREFLPTPAGVKDGVFYNCIACYAAQIDKTKWDAAAFAKAILERVILPSKHAVDLLAGAPYLTRMYTTLSPVEMTEDPEFHLRADLPPVASFHMGTRQLDCGGVSGMALGSRAFATPSGWPAWPAEMPYAERVEDIPLTGPVVTLVDNGDKIDAVIADWNKQYSWPPPPPTGTGGKSGASGSSGGGAKAGAAGAQGGAGPAGAPAAGGPAAAGAAAAGEAGAPTNDAASADSEGGGCSVAGGARSTWPLLSGAALIGLAAGLRRRLRRAAR